MIKVKLFGIAKDIVSSSFYEIDGGITVGDLKVKLSNDFPSFSDLRSFLVAINDEYAYDQEVIKESDEVAIIPPVSGG